VLAVVVAFRERNNVVTERSDDDEFDHRPNWDEFSTSVSDFDDGHVSRYKLSHKNVGWDSCCA
jgi:hypothetical protein